MNDHEHRGDSPPPLERYEADDGAVVIFDAETPSAWIKGDYMRLDRWR